MENDILIRINQTLSQSYLSEHDWEALQVELAIYLNELITSDYTKLMTILYQIDVSEMKVRQALSQNGATSNTGVILASLIIKRQREKIRFRREFGH